MISITVSEIAVVMLLYPLQTDVVNIMNQNRKACCPFMIICFENDVV